MDKIVSKLLIYSDIPQDSILLQLASVCSELRKGEYDKEDLITKIYKQIKKILVISTDYGFDDNLWHNYLTFLLVTNENPFSITCEKVGASDGSVNHFAKHDFKMFKELFDYDFSEIENKLGIDCFSHISNYTAITKPELMYNHNVSEKVRTLSKKLLIFA